MASVPYIIGDPYIDADFASLPSGNVASSGNLTSGQLLVGGGNVTISVGDLSGDVTTSGATATTLATVNGNVGTFGNATNVARVTVNAKGLVTAVSSVAITGAGGGASGQTTVASPTAAASTVAYQMQGLAGSITPTKTGNVLITIGGYTSVIAGASAGDGVLFQISYGTGAAPANGDALTGTQLGLAQKFGLVAATAPTKSFAPFSISARVTGLTLSTTYWIDLAAEAVQNASHCLLNNVTVTAIEF